MGTVEDASTDPVGTTTETLDFVRCELGGLGAGGCGPGGGGSQPGGDVTLGPGQRATDKLFAYNASGIVQGTISAGAPYKVDVVRGGVVKATAKGTTNAQGMYRAAVPYHDGIGEGLHQGDVVKVVDQKAKKTYSQPIGLGGLLDERSGRFKGVAQPNAQVNAKLYRVFDHATVVAERSVVADSAGLFTINWADYYTAGATADRPPWRGYDVEVAARNVANQGQYQEFSTVSPTLASTYNQGGGGYFYPGDNVTFELWNNGALRDSKSAVANGDGIPRAVFGVDVGDGDMMRTRYHDAAGAEQFIDMDPWKLSVNVDLVARTVRGAVAPGVAVQGNLKLADGTYQNIKTTAAGDGSYLLQYSQMQADQQLSVFRVADSPGKTGVAVHQILMHTPVVRVNDLTGEVSGNGAHGVNPAVIEVLRGGSAVASKTVTTTKPGKYSGKVAAEFLPGDQVRVTTGGFVHGPFAVGDRPLSMHRSGTKLSGTATPGRKVTVGKPGCIVSATATAGGAWEATPSCTLAATDAVTVWEEEVAGPTIGSWRGRVEWVTAPDVTITAPAATATVGAPVTIKGDAFDYDDNKAPAEVRFYIDGTLAFTDVAAPFEYTASLGAGAHTVVLEAVDASRRRDAANNEIWARTPVRSFRIG